MEPVPPPDPSPQPRHSEPRPAPAEGRQGPPRPSTRGDEGRRRRPSVAERRYAGFGDDTERAWCASLGHVVPPAFPVQARTGCATLKMATVAQRPGALLLCDGSHPGPHRWPDGSEVAPDELA